MTFKFIHLCRPSFRKIIAITFTQITKKTQLFKFSILRSIFHYYEYSFSTIANINRNSFYKTDASSKQTHTLFNYRRDIKPYRRNRSSQNEYSHHSCQQDHLPKLFSQFCSDYLFREEKLHMKTHRC